MLNHHLDERTPHRTLVLPDKQVPIHLKYVQTTGKQNNNILIIVVIIIISITITITITNISLAINHITYK